MAVKSIQPPQTSGGEQETITTELIAKLQAVDFAGEFESIREKNVVAEMNKGVLLSASISNNLKKLSPYPPSSLKPADQKLISKEGLAYLCSKVVPEAIDTLNNTKISKQGNTTIKSGLKSLDTLARRNLNYYSFPTDTIGLNGMFIPNGAYNLFKQVEEGYREKFEKIREVCVQTYSNKILNRIEDNMNAYLVKLYLEQTPGAHVDSLLISKQVKAYMKLLPSKQEVGEYLVYNLSINILPGYFSVPYKSKQYIEMYTDILTGDKSLPSTLSIDVCSAAEIQVSVASELFLVESIIYMRGALFQTVNSTLNSIYTNNMKLLGRPVIGLTKALVRLEALNFFDDESLTEILGTIEYLLMSENRDVEEIAKVLLSVKEWAKQSVIHYHKLLGRMSRDKDTKSQPASFVFPEQKGQAKIEALVDEVVAPATTIRIPRKQ